MHTVKISALGPLKEKITQEQDVQLSGAEQTAFELVDEKFGIPKTESRMCFVINGKIQKGSYILQANDSIVVLKMGGAG